MNVLELFSGTKSIGKVCKQLGWESVSVDMILPADHQVDIMNFNYKQYPKDHFDIVWASPPCTAYSNLQSCWLGRKKKDGNVFTKEIMEADMNEADMIVKKTLEIINYFDCEYWFMENPATGKLKSREFMKDIPFYDVSYCMYSDWGYEKRTRIWTNKKDWDNKICDKSGACGNMIQSQHKKVLGNGYEMIDGEKVICNTKKLRLIHSDRMGTSKTILDNGKIIRVNTAELRKKYKDYPNIQNESKKHKKTAQGGSSKSKGEWVKNGTTTQLDRYRIPEDLIFSLFLE
tara:strand:+ start:1005 stop:1868 length:864 start_codon:yes stop_codon:yes gene_type:complete